ncbi:MAG: hypothetical protein U9N34_00635 [Candidatus Cloacimonadota bacterium]|nr:hypothetical protein [Candidatus Cloacimonadota bacterium]
MNIMLDIVWATIIGGMLLLAMVTSIMDIQAVSTNLIYQTSLAKVTEQRVDMIDYYFGKVGAGVHPDSTTIMTTIDTVFTFRAKEFSTDANPSTFSFSQGAPTTNGIPVEITKDGNRVYGPIWLSESMSITYYNRSNALLPFPLSSADMESVGSVRISLTPFMRGAFRRGNSRNITNQIVFWETFVNLYL